MTTDYRDLCAELLDWAERTSAHYVVHPDVILRARAALAQPGPVALTNEEILSLADDCGLDHDWECTAEEILTFARTIQQRSTPSAIEPVPQQEAV
jgi:hypothetical protein